MKLITLQQASDHLRRDTDADNADLELKVEGGSMAVINYLKRQGMLKFAATDSAGNFLEDTAGMLIPLAGKVIPREVQVATCLMVGYLYKDRDEDSDKEWEMGYLPRPITAILYPLRKPAVA